MRKLVLVLAVVFAATVIAAAIADAATSTTKSGQTTVAKKHVAKTGGKAVCKSAAKKKSMPSKAARGPSKKSFYKGCKTMKKASMHARWARGPKHHYAKRSAKMICKPKMKAKRIARPARAARGPSVTCPAPTVTVPQQAAPVVNVPQQPAPVVNIPANPPSTAISVDNCNIYIVRENQLTILDKSTYQVKQTVPLQ